MRGFARAGHLRIVVGVFVVAAVLGGCGRESGGGSGRIEGGAVGGSEVGNRKAFDPPTKFDDRTAVELPDGVAGTTEYRLSGIQNEPLPMALVGTSAFVAGLDALTIVDVTDGEVRRTIQPKLPVGRQDRGSFTPNKPTPPVVTDLDGGPALVVPFVVNVPGQGTTAARLAVEIVAIRPDGVGLWSIQVDLRSSANLALLRDTAVVGVASGVLVLRAEGSTYGVDLRTKATVWHRPDLEAETVVGDTVVGVSTNGHGGYVAAGASVVDGTKRWADAKVQSHMRVWPGGPTFVVAVGSDRAAPMRILEGATGKVRHITGAGQFNIDPTCVYDQAAVTVCSDIDWITAFDAGTGDWLWQLPDKQTKRTTVKMTTAWHGAVYGTTGNGPIVLDARTGADRELNPVIAPYVVNGYAGIASWPTRENELFAFGAAG